MTTVSGLPHDVRVTFPAKYDSNCPECNQAIYEGDPIGFVDDICVCPDCHELAQQANRAALRKQLDAADAADQAEDPEGHARRQAAAKHWLDRVRAKAAQEDGKEWVTSPEGSGWVRNPDHEPPPEQETEMAVEPGIQALMAAGLLEGQQPGGSGVCVAEIVTAGKVTEVEIPVPVDPPRPSVASAEPVADRQAELAQAAAAWTPEQAHQDVLQASLQAAVDSGTLTPEQAAGLGWQTADPAPSPWETYHSAVNELGGAWPDANAVPLVPEGLEPVHAAPLVRQGADVFLAALEASTPAEEPRILAALDNLPAYVGRDSMDAEKRDLLAVIQGAIDNHPRSLQVKIGPSEIGTECDHCLAAKLAGWPQVETNGGWLPTVGTAVHSWIEDAFRLHPDGPEQNRRYLTERKVAVGEIDGEEITGSTDLVDVVAGWTWDWKIVGPTTLKSAKVRPAQHYVVQQMLYARGWNRMGVKITHVGIAYLPRNAMSLASSVFWSAPYDEQIAIDALERATNMARNLKAMEAIGGAEMRDKYITGLDRWRKYRTVIDGTERDVEGNAQEGRIICLDCPRYPDNPNLEQPDPAQLEGLM